MKGYSSSHDQLALDIRPRCWLRVLACEGARLSPRDCVFPRLPESLRSSTNLRSRIVMLHVRVSQRSVIRDHQVKIAGKCQGLSSPDGFIIDVSWLVYNKNVGESGHSISSYSDSSRYSTSMLTEGAQVDSSSTCQLWAPSVNISVEYPELPDHDSMNNPSFYYSVIRFQIFRVNRGTWLVNSCHVTQTQMSVYFGTDMLKWPCSTRGQAHVPWRDDITKDHIRYHASIIRRTYVSFVNARKP